MKQRGLSYWRVLQSSAQSSTAREAAIVLVGNMTSALLRFIVTVVLAHSTSKAEFAYFALFIAVMDLSTIAADSGLNNTMVRFLAMNRGKDIRPLLWRSLVIRAVLWVGVIVLGAIALWPFFATQQVDANFRWMYPAAIASGLFISVSIHGMSVMQGLSRFTAFSILTLSVNVLRVAGLAICFLAGWTQPAQLFAAFFFLPVLTLPIVPFWTRSATRGLAGEPIAENYSTLLKYMAPVGAVTILTVVLQRFDVFLLKAWADDEAVADFAVAFQLAFVFPLIARSLFTVLLPKASAMTTAEELARYRRRTLVLYPVLLAVVALAVVVAPWILALTFGERYASSAPILRLLIIAFGMHIVFNPLSVILYSIEKHRWVPLIHLIQVPMLIALDFWLIPIHGGFGAAIGALAIRVFGVIAVLVLTGLAIEQMKTRQRESV